MSKASPATPMKAWLRLFKVPCSRVGVGVALAVGVLEVELGATELELELVGGGLDDSVELVLVVLGRAFDVVVGGGGGGVEVVLGV